MWKSALAVMVIGLGAAAAPSQPPTVYAPARDGGWTARPPYLRAQYQPTIPLDVNRFEFEVESPPGTLIARQVVPVNRASSTWLVSWYSPSPPDAGLHWWRVRALDVNDAPSPWMEWESFRIDDGAPPYPATVTLDAQDGGHVAMSCAPVSDPQSGLAAYHWMFGQLDMPDGGVGATFSGPTSSAPAREFRLGPGRWTVGVHAHDNVGNSLSSSAVWVPLSGPAPTLGAVPPLIVTQSNGMAWPAAPFQNVNRAYFRFPALSFDAGAYTIIQSLGDAGVWGFSVDSTTSTTNVYQNDGRYEFRYAAFVGGESSAWSSSVFIHVDATPPGSTGRVDAGLSGTVVSLSWAAALDANPNTTGSGIGTYEVSRQAGDAGALVATVSSSAALVASETPPPGLWTYFVHSRDRALNRSTDAGRVVVSVPPEAPGTPRPGAMATDGAVSLSWDWDGGPATFELDRLDDDGGVVAVQLALPAPRFTDTPGEGRWRYASRAVVLDAPGPSSAPSVSVIVDQSGPFVGAPAASRLAPREVQVTWSATDLLTSVSSVVVERETNGAVTALGPGASPLSDSPPDGAHRYRVIAADAVGNTSTSAWSMPIDTPGVALVIAPVEPVQASCGRTLSVVLSATGDGPVRWSLLEAPAGATVDEASGVVSWTPTPAEAGAHVVRVRADAPSTTDEEALNVEVTCQRVVLGVGCGCATPGGAFVWVLAVLLGLRRRRAAR
ncbi:MAG: hypothetical protein JNJ54_16795 [Myxococcaceae bacterium]|nr:hypothetical protein [Myxococcaceae bacterium]